MAAGVLSVSIPYAMTRKPNRVREPSPGVFHRATAGSGDGGDVRADQELKGVAMRKVGDETIQQAATFTAHLIAEHRRTDQGHSP